ncbi:acyl-CoA dehydrogenase family member 10-like [Oscarella lobularis]|uniref:acyl-CoA dehydrogenase family member 10-like n=1 Tax=Oscarella lobularis TaxID=121494 RepID=UPI003313ECB9
MFSLSRLARSRYIVSRCLVKCYSMKSAHQKSWKAVLFDAGGVLVASPFPAFRRFENDNDLTPGTLTKVIQNAGDTGPFAKLERGEFTVPEFCEKFDDDIRKATGKEVNSRALMNEIESATQRPVYEMFDAIRCIRAENIKTALVTNNWITENQSISDYLPKNLFNEVFESCKEGKAKPDPSVYATVLSRLNVAPNDTIFLDDIGRNLKRARELGIHTIKVDQPKEALRELEALLGFPLSGYVNGTLAVKKQHRLPIDSLILYLRRTLGLNQEGPPNVRKFKHGQSNPTYFVGYGGEDLVLRKKPPGKLLASAHQVEREYKVMKAVGSVGVPVPTVLDLCEDESVLGTPFYVMKYVHGEVLIDPTLKNLTLEQRQKVYMNTIETLAKIHLVDLKACDLMDYGKHGNYISRQVARWTRQYKASQTSSIPSMERLIKWLPENLPSKDRTTIVHGDYRIDNLIFSENYDVVAVLDWELSTLGDPIADLASACFAYHIDQNLPGLRGLNGVDLESLGIPSEDECVAHYCSKMGYEQIDDWNIYIAFCFFRMAAIIQGVYKRATQGQASAENAEMIGMLTEYMSNLGWKYAEEEQTNKKSKL